MEEIFEDVCNCCGGKIGLLDRSGEKLSHRFGYNSEFDNECWDIALCDSCIEKIIKTFKFSPKGFMDCGMNILSEEEHQKVFDEYKECGYWNDVPFMSDCALEDMHDYGYLSDDTYHSEIERRGDNERYKC